MHQQLKEGLRPLDLKEMVYDTFEVDTFRSKMGEDKDVCVVSFKVKDRSPAKDMMEFVEKGYSFVLDADVSSGEDNQGEYSVFIELNRSPSLAEEIKELTYGIKRLTGIDSFKFKYHKQDTIHEASEDNLRAHIPSSAIDYDGFVNRIRTESVKSFFNKTLMDDLSLNGTEITIHKPFDQKIKLQWLNEEDPQPVVEGAIILDDQATAETFWLTKVLGDYNINKIGENFVFTNGNKTMILKRIEL